MTRPYLDPVNMIKTVLLYNLVWYGFDNDTHVLRETQHLPAIILWLSTVYSCLHTDW